MLRERFAGGLVRVVSEPVRVFAFELRVQAHPGPRGRGLQEPRPVLEQAEVVSVRELPVHQAYVPPGPRLVLRVPSPVGLAAHLPALEGRGLLIVTSNCRKHFYGIKAVKRRVAFC